MISVIGASLGLHYRTMAENWLAIGSRPRSPRGMDRPSSYRRRERTYRSCTPGPQSSGVRPGASGVTFGYGGVAYSDTDFHRADETPLVGAQPSTRPVLVRGVGGVREISQH